MKKIKNNLFQIAHELHEDICGGTHTSWYGRNDMSLDEQNKEVINKDIFSSKVGSDSSCSC
mgnify:CR=1 FL=1